LCTTPLSLELLIIIVVVLIWDYYYIHSTAMMLHHLRRTSTMMRWCDFFIGEVVRPWQLYSFLFTKSLFVLRHMQTYTLTFLFCTRKKSDKYTRDKLLARRLSPYLPKTMIFPNNREEHFISIIDIRNLIVSGKMINDGTFDLLRVEIPIQENKKSGSHPGDKETDRYYNKLFSIFNFNLWRNSILFKSYDTINLFYYASK